MRREEAYLRIAATDVSLFGCTTTAGMERNMISFMNLGISDWSREYKARSPGAETMRTSLSPRERRSFAMPSPDGSSFAENSVGGGGGPELLR
jgi:hypothetical protein